MIRPNRAKTWIAACALLPLAACGKGGESQDETYTVRTPSPTPSASPTNAPPSPKAYSPAPPNAGRRRRSGW